MYIIVDGPDGAGKSTLISQLLKVYPGSIKLHFSKPNSKEEAENYWKVYAQAIIDNKDRAMTIFDRSWISDMVYGPVMRGTIELDEIKEKALTALIIQNGGGHVIYCTAKIDILWKRCQKRGELYIPNKEKLKELSDKYEEVMSTKVSLPVVAYDTSRCIMYGSKT